MIRASSARTVAAQVLVRVFRDEAFAAPTLSVALEESALSQRDRALCTEICYGVLRTEKHLRRLVSSLGKVRAGEHELWAHLLVAAYQIEFLDRVPNSAAVNEAVQAIRADKNERVSGFANALLRRLSQRAEERGTEEQRTEERRLSYAEAVGVSCPAWLRKRLTREWGEPGALALLAPQKRPSAFLRLRTGRKAPDWFEEFAEPCRGVPGAFLYKGGGDPRRRTGYAERDFVVQELGAQLLGHALGVLPGERVLDTCAGRGQKALLLSEQAGSGGVIVATDLYPRKVEVLRAELEGGPAQARAEVFDFTLPVPDEWKGRFDRILVDAPCTGVGTLGRRPEILRRLGPEDPARLGDLQFRIVCSAAEALRPGGTLLFATCSVLSAEGPDVVTRVLEATKLRLFSAETPVDAVLFPEGTGRASSFRLGPDSHGTDGYFAARFTLPST